jgi:hypothetical protein
MRLLGWLMAAAVGWAASPAWAQAPDVLFRGTARAALAHGTGGWCAVELGPSLFQRNSAKKALISFPALHYTLTTLTGGTYYTLSGQARMSFTTPTRGTLQFDEPTSYPSDVRVPDFTEYSETYNPTKGSLIVRFRVKFTGCEVVVRNTYWD